MSKQVILYMPVIHAGYERFLMEHQDATEVLLLGTSFHEIFPQLKKDIRALRPFQIAAMARPLIPATLVRVVELRDFESLISADHLVLPDEDIMRDLVSRFALNAVGNVIFVSTFLRWDRSRAEAEKELPAGQVISTDRLDLILAGLASEQSHQSPDWWRQVGAVAWKDNNLLYASFNDHHPTAYTAGIDGDPRGNFKGGIRVELSLAEHAEAWIVARSARDGVSLDGATLAVTTFPCPACARLIITAGIKRLVFQTGYVLLDGDELLRQAGVEIIRVAPN